MFAYKLTAVFVTAILGAAIAVAFAYAPANREVAFAKAAKLDISARQLEGPQIAWPYGCEWRPQTVRPLKHVRRGRDYGPLFSKSSND